MRKVILGCAMSLDGYIARPDGSVDFLPAPEAGPEGAADLFSSIDVAFFGRKTIEAGDGQAPPKTPWTIYVFSRTRPPGEGEHGFIFVNQSPEEFVRDLRKQPGKNLFHMGGGELARSFLEADLVDELAVSIVPVLLGEGIPLFPPGFPQREFTLIETHNFSNGAVSLKYERNRSA